MERYDDDEFEDARRPVDERVRAAIEAADARLAQRLAETRTPEWRPPEPASPPVVKSAPRREGRRRELPAWVTLQIRNEAAAAVRRELRSEAKGGLADQLGKVLARERAEFRRNLDALVARIVVLEAVQRAAPDNGVATVLDLSDERRRRA